MFGHWLFLSKQSDCEAVKVPVSDEEWTCVSTEIMRGVRKNRGPPWLTVPGFTPPCTCVWQCSGILMLGLVT